MYKLICIDLDGTLLNKQGEITEDNRLAIRHALDEGLHVALVSGRPNCFTIRMMNQISGRMGHITFNGAYYRISNKTKTFPIDKNSIKEIAHIAMEMGVGVFFKNKNTGVYTKDNPHIFDYDEHRAETPKKDLLDLYYNVDVEEYFNTHDMDVLKIFVWEEDEAKRKRFEEAVKKVPHLHVYSYSHTFEVSSDLASKGLAISAVCQDLGISLDEVVAIGDNYNDLPMFEVAGLSIAMGNAPDVIKQQADKVTLTNEESGVAYAIEQFVLK